MKRIRRLIVGLAAAPAFAANVIYVNATTANDTSPSYCPAHFGV